MQFCPTCGAQQQQPGQFCRGCGTDLRSIRTALTSPPVPVDTARLEIARAMTAKIAALDPSDRRLAKKIANIREEAEKLLDSGEERRKKHLMRLIAFVGGGFLIVMIGLIEKVVSRGGVHEAEGLFVVAMISLLATLTALLLANIFPRHRQPARTELPVPYPTASTHTSRLAESVGDPMLLTPPSVTEGTTYNLPKVGVPVPVAERNTR